MKKHISPNSVSTLWGSYGRSKEWCSSRCPFASAGFDCAGSHRVLFATTVPNGSGRAGFWIVLPGVRARFEAKRGFTGQAQKIGGFWRWQVQGIGHFVKIMAGAVFCGRCQNIGRRVSFEGLRFTWQAQGIRSMDPMFWGRRARFLRKVAFLELQLDDAFAWPVRRMTSSHDFMAGAVLLKHSSAFEEVSQKTLVLEAWIFNFCECLAEFARFGFLDL